MRSPNFLNPIFCRKKGYLREISICRLSQKAENPRSSFIYVRFQELNDMPPKMENVLAKEFKKRFEQTDEPKFDKIYVSKRPFQASKLKKLWHEMYGRPLNVPISLVPPLQPEIDMILCKGNELTAVELKYFWRKGRGLNHSFYEGIEQTLALLRWGFDHVALWQLFEEKISKEELWFYGVWTWNFLHAKPEQLGLNLPIEFTFYIVQKVDNGYDFRPVNPVRKGGKFGLVCALPPYHPDFRIHAKYKNPLLIRADVRRLREMMIDWLQTQKT